MKEFKEGQWAWSIKGGWERITKVESGKPGYSVSVAEEYYTAEGRLKAADCAPSLFHMNPFDLSDKPPCEFKEGEIVMMSDDMRHWHPIGFK